MHKYNRFVTLKDQLWSIGKLNADKVNDLVKVRRSIVRRDRKYAYRPESGDLPSQIERRLGS